METEVINRVFREFVFPTLPTETPLATLKACGNEKMRVRQLLPVFLKNQAYLHFLMQLTVLAQKVKDWRSEVPENVDHSLVIVDRILGLMGKDLIRNYTVGMALFRTLGAGLPRKAQGGGVNLNPPDLLPFAIGTQDYCLDKKLMHVDMAFNGGLIYDWINCLLSRAKASQDQKNYLKETYAEGMRMAKIAYRIAQNMGRIEHDRYVFAGALMIPAGKAVMNVIFPKEEKEKSWAQFIADCEKHPHGKRAATLAFEAKKFSIRHAEISSLLASFSEMLRPVERAIFYYNTPYYLSSSNKSLATLGGLWSLAATGAAHPDGKFKLEPHQEKFVRNANLSLEMLKKIAGESKAEKG
ncbi:MAG: hypothetical protein ACK5QT_05275 [Oligoflexia bacterium]